MRGRSGFTLLETMLAVVLLVLVMGSIVLFDDSLSSSYRTMRASAELDARARKTVQEIAERLRAASAGEMNPVVESPFFTDTLDYRGIEGFTGGVPDWSALERIVLEEGPDDPDDGIDNDGDGLVDERQVVWIRNPGQPNERRSVLCRDVRKWMEGEIPGNGLDDNGNGLVDEAGLAFDFPPGFPDDTRYVRIQLSLQSREVIGQSITTTVERTVSFRVQQKMIP